MLVLTRSPGESVVFPSLGIKIHLNRVQGEKVRIGIEAPPEVSVLRGELVHGSVECDSGDRSPLSHAARNRLNKLFLKLYSLQKKSAQLDPNDFQERFGAILAEFDATNRETPLPGKNPNRRLKALLVEDDPNEGELLANLLEMNGHSCVLRRDGEDALHHLETNERPDIVLLDMMMPRCNGVQFVNRLRSSPRFADLKVVAVSGTSPMDLGVAVGPTGVDLWFAKPLNPKKLLDMMTAN